MMNKRIFRQLFLDVVHDSEGKEYAFDNYGRYYDTCKHIEPFINKDSKVLDIGIYPGHLAIMIKHLFEDPEMAGISTTTTGHFQSLMGKIGISLYNTNIENEPLPFNDGTFNVILASEIIEHLYDPGLFIKEAYRVLVPGGYFVVSTPNLARLRNRIQFFFAGKPVMEHLHGNIDVFDTNDWTHKREYTYHEIFRMFEAAGFHSKKKGFTSLTHYPSTKKIALKNNIKRCVYLSPQWKGGLICTGKKPEK